MAKNFAKKFAESKTTLGGGVSVSVRPARTKLNGQRNYSLRRASDVLKKESPTKKVELNWKNRSVTVNGEDAFIQGKLDTAGNFMGSYAHLKLE